MRETLLLRSFVILATTVVVWAAGWVMNLVFLEDTEARATAEALNRVGAPLYDRSADGIRDDILAVEFDADFLRIGNRIAGIVRQSPPHYAVTAGALNAIRDQLEPEAVFLDYYFENIREDEPFLDVLKALCAYAPEACRFDPAGEGRFVCGGEGRSVPVFVAVYDPPQADRNSEPIEDPPRDENGNPPGRLFHLYEMAAECAHLTLVDVEIPGHYAYSNDYPVRSKNPEVAQIADTGEPLLYPAFAIVRELCDRGSDKIAVSECERVKARFDPGQSADRLFNPIWGNDRKVAHEGEPTACVPERLADGPKRSRAALRESRRSTTAQREVVAADALPTADCPAQPMITMSDLKREIAYRDEYGIAERLLDRIVMIGPGRDTLDDPYVPPVGQALTSGLYLHATALENLLLFGADVKMNEPRYFDGFWRTFAMVLGFSVVFGLAYHILKDFQDDRCEQMKPHWGEMISLVTSFAIIVILWCIAASIFFFGLDWSINKWASLSLFGGAVTLLTRRVAESILENRKSSARSS